MLPRDDVWAEDKNHPRMSHCVSYSTVSFKNVIRDVSPIDESGNHEIHLQSLLHYRAEERQTLASHGTRNDHISIVTQLISNQSLVCLRAAHLAPAEPDHGWLRQCSGERCAKLHLVAD